MKFGYHKRQTSLKKQHREYAFDTFGNKIVLYDLVVFHSNRLTVGMIIGLSKNRVRVWTKLCGEEIRHEENLLKISPEEVPTSALEQFNDEELQVHLVAPKLDLL